MTHVPSQARAQTLDTTRIDDVRIGAVRPLITPALLQEWLPAQPAQLALVEASRAAIADVLPGMMADRIGVEGLEAIRQKLGVLPEPPARLSLRRRFAHVAKSSLCSMRS